MSVRLEPIETARDCVRTARRIAVLTGAGMSAESGVPTFAMRRPACGRASIQRNSPLKKGFALTRRWSGAGTPGGAKRSRKPSPMQDTGR